MTTLPKLGASVHPDNGTADGIWLPSPHRAAWIGFFAPEGRSCVAWGDSPRDRPRPNNRVPRRGDVGSRSGEHHWHQHRPSGALDGLSGLDSWGCRPGRHNPAPPGRKERARPKPDANVRRIAWLLAALLLARPAPIRAQDLPADITTAPANPKADAAIRRALGYLKGQQKPDGAWESGNFGKATSITSLAVMAYLAAGHVPGEPGPYREAIEGGIRYVLAHQKPNGLLVSGGGHEMYCHGISTLMLAEVVGMTSDPELAAQARAALAKAVDLILRAQAVKKKSPADAGGWRYRPQSDDSDISVTGWQVMALRAAKSAGCAVSADSIDRAVAYIKRCAVKSRGGFSYTPGGGPNNSRTGTGILSLEICGAHLTPEAVAGAEYLRKHPPRWASEFFYYEVYYCPQAMFQVGDEYFRDYYPKLVAILLEHQEPDGCWPPGGGSEGAGGRNYGTAMAVLALAVEYRYLPIYQR